MVRPLPSLLGLSAAPVAHPRSSWASSPSPCWLLLPAVPGAWCPALATQGSTAENVRLLRNEGLSAPANNSFMSVAEKDGGVEGCTLIFSWENSKSTTRCWTTMDRRMLDPTKKDIPHPRAKGKPQKDSRRGEITFRIKLHTYQRHSEGSNKPCVHQDPKTPQRLSQNCECLLWR